MSFNLLIVDDEAPIRKGLSEHIKWEDYDCKVVATANNGEDAIAKINENVINIILTDVKMPLWTELAWQSIFTRIILMLP